MKLSLFVVVPALLSGVVAYAQPDEEVIRAMVRGSTLSAEDARRDYNSCDSGETRSMKICGFYLLTKEDVRMNRLYKAAVKDAKQFEYEASLVRAQRAWLTYRDAACELEGQAGAGGGSAEGLYVLSCKAELTKERADRLERIIQKEPR
jgi:uncharacterized protein YecT (DUF1311 family)